LETEWQEAELEQAANFHPGTGTAFMLESRAEEPSGGSQSVCSSEEAGNDRGAKGRRKVESVKEPETEQRPATVKRRDASAAFSKQAGETPARWAWVERSVWTERMLKRLEQSQEQTVWYSLWDKVWQTDNLNQAIMEVMLKRGSAGVDRQSTAQLAMDWTQQSEQLQQELRTGSYRPQPALRAWIPKLGSTELRPLGIPAVRDRVVQTAMLAVMEPIFERDFAEQSHGFRPGRGCLQALERVESLLQGGHTWVVDADIKAYFDTIPHERLMALVAKRIADGKVLELLDRYLKAGVMATGKEWQASEQGTPQGAVISPLLANVYLNPLDHQMAGEGYQMVRYADDFVVCTRTREQAAAALETIRKWVEAAGLTLHPTKTRIVNAAERGGFDFLGYHFEQYGQEGGKKWPRQKSRQKLRDSLREKLPRGRSGSIQQIAAEINPMLKGWYGYFKYSLPSAMQGADEWVRERIRHIIRRRQKRKGMVKGRERVEYPNAWFAAQGLFSLKNAQTQWLQSRTGNH
jgi:RNA-directed DNA polymerase